MKKSLKIIALILSFLLIFASASVGFASDEKGSYVLLGDSIAQGYGIRNRSEACYGRIIADTLGYSYTNYGLAASTTDDLLYSVKNRYDVRSSVESADIISISIGGNDYLCDDKVVSLAFSVLLNVNLGHFNEITDRLYNNLCGIIGEIKTLNPDALILVQTVYSSWYGLPGIPYGKATGAVNSCIEKYDDEHPGEIEIVDVASAFAGRKELVADDTIHPNARGNIELSKVILSKLNELGVTDITEPVVNGTGVDYNYYVSYFGNEIIGKIVTFLIKSLTGNLIK